MTKINGNDNGTDIYNDDLGSGGGTVPAITRPPRIQLTGPPLNFIEVGETKRINAQVYDE